MATLHSINSYARNSSYVIPGVYDIETQDVAWVLVASIVIFTMQTGNRHTVLIESDKCF